MNSFCRRASSKAETTIFGEHIEILLIRQRKLYPKSQVPFVVDSAVQYVLKYGKSLSNEMAQLMIHRTKGKGHFQTPYALYKSEGSEGQTRFRWVCCASLF